MDFDGSLHRTKAVASKPAVLFLHGVRASKDIWASQLAAAHAAGYQVLAIDLPGHGVEPEVEHFSLADAFSAIDDALARDASSKPVVLVGLSLGGYTALAYAATHPDAPLAGIVAAGCAGEPKWKMLSAYRVLAGTANAGYHHSVKTLRRLRHVPEPEPMPPWALVTDALRELAGHSTKADIRAIKAPIWFVNGALDPLRLQNREFTHLAQNGASVIIPNAGHDVNTDQPELFNQVLVRALNEFSSQ